MLQVISILMIVFGAIATVIELIGLVAIIAAIALGASPLFLLAYILLIAGGIAELVVGIIGVINCKNPEKAQMLLTCGIVVTVLTLVGNILSMILGGDFNAFGLISGMLFPILFIVGSLQLKKGA